MLSITVSAFSSLHVFNLYLSSIINIALIRKKIHESKLNVFQFCFTENKVVCFTSVVLERQEVASIDFSSNYVCKY